MRKKTTVRIKKEEFPKARRKWNRRPETQVVLSKKTYKRSRSKINARKTIKNEFDKKD